MVYFTIFNNELVYASHYANGTGWIMLDSFLTTEYCMLNAVILITAFACY